MVGNPSIDSLRRLKIDFEKGANEFPDLYYAVVSGQGVSNGGVAFRQSDGTYVEFEQYLKSHNALNRPCAESEGWKQPRYFFFGNDLQGLPRFAALCQLANKVIRDGLDAVRQVPGSGADLNGGILPEHWHLLGENLYEHEWMYWMTYLGKTLNHPLLTPKADRVQFCDVSADDESLDEVPDLFQLWVPTIEGNIAFRFHRVNMTREEWVAALPPWKEIVACDQSDWLEKVSVFDSPIFYSSAIAIDEIIRLVSPPKATPPAQPKVQTIAPGTLPPTATANKPRKLRSPSEIAFTAYRLHIAVGSTQTHIAETLTEQFRVPVRQSDVSRHIARVTRWLEAGNVLPPVSRPALKPQPVDPAKIDSGKRIDQITPRQRGRRVE